MSKTKGNVIDPLDVVDQFGSDALRYSLVTGSTPGQDVPLSMERIESNRLVSLAALHCTVLHCTVLCCTLCWTALCHALLSCDLICCALHCC